MPPKVFCEEYDFFLAQSPTQTHGTESMDDPRVAGTVKSNNAGMFVYITTGLPLLSAA